MLIDDGGFDNRICSAMRNQHRLADLGQEVVIMEGPREQALTDMEFRLSSGRLGNTAVRRFTSATPMVICWRWSHRGVWSIY